MLVGGFNQSSLNVALPDVATALHASASQMNWVLLGYLLANSGLMIVFGRLADMFSRRRMWSFGIAIFTLASFAVGFSQAPWQAIVLRTISGVGAAMMWSTSGALLTAWVPRRMLGQAMGIYYASSSVAQLLGPVLGGVIADSLGWRWLFWVNVPIGLAGSWAGFALLRKESKPAVRERFDVIGAVAGVLFLGAVVTTFNTVGTEGWANPDVVIGLVVMLIVGPFFFWWERRIETPILDLTLFHERLFAWASAASFLNQAVRFGLLLFVALIYQSLHGLSAAEAGLVVLPIAIGTMVSSPWAGTLERRVSSATISRGGSYLTLGGLLVCTGMIWLPNWYVFVIVGGFVAGFGGGMVITANTSAIMSRAPRHRLGVVSSLRVMLQSLGVILGSAGILTAVTAALPTDGKSAVYSGAGSLPASYQHDLALGVPIALGLLVVLAIGTIMTSQQAYLNYEMQSDEPSAEPRLAG